METLKIISDRFEKELQWNFWVMLFHPVNFGDARSLSMKISRQSRRRDVCDDDDFNRAKNNTESLKYWNKWLKKLDQIEILSFNPDALMRQKTFCVRHAKKLGQNFFIYIHKKCNLIVPRLHFNIYYCFVLHMHSLKIQ